MMFILGAFETGEPMGVSWWVVVYFLVTLGLGLLKSWGENQR
jgi:hypothetical protein